MGIISAQVTVGHDDKDGSGSSRRAFGEKNLKTVINTSTAHWLYVGPHITSQLFRGGFSLMGGAQGRREGITSAP
eukprot:12932496-Prorocentrum_lima.AAC.1